VFPSGIFPALLNVYGMDTHINIVLPFPMKDSNNVHLRA
jgi:hypothetical protein